MLMNARNLTYLSNDCAGPLFIWLLQFLFLDLLLASQKYLPLKPLESYPSFQYPLQ